MKDWEAALPFEVMEDYLRCAELKHLAKDPVAHMEEMRAHWEKLKQFITSLLKERDEDLMAGIGLLRRPINHSGGASGYCAGCGQINSECECVGFNLACDQIISLITKRSGE